MADSQRWLIVEGISVKADKTGKESTERQSTSEGIIKKVKGGDAERQTTATYGKPQSP